MTVKVITTRVVEGESAEGGLKEVTLSKTGLRVTCENGSVLEVSSPFLSFLAYLLASPPFIGFGVGCVRLSEGGMPLCVDLFTVFS